MIWFLFFKNTNNPGNWIYGMLDLWNAGFMVL